MADTLVYVGLGANLAQPVQQLERAVLALQSIKDTELVQVSSFYGSKPMGPQDQPDYVNAVAALATRLSADDLLTEHIVDAIGCINTLIDHVLCRNCIDGIFNVNRPVVDGQCDVFHPLRLINETNSVAV